MCDVCVCVCGVWCVWCAVCTVCPVCAFFLVSKKGQSKRRLLWHFQKRKECTVYFAFFRGLPWSHTGGCFRVFSNRIPRGILFEVYSGPIRSGLSVRPFLIIWAGKTRTKPKTLTVFVFVWPNAPRQLRKFHLHLRKPTKIGFLNWKKQQKKWNTLKVSWSGLDTVEWLFYRDRAWSRHENTTKFTVFSCLVPCVARIGRWLLPGPRTVSRNRTPHAPKVSSTSFYLYGIIATELTMQIQQHIATSLSAQALVTIALSCHILIL
jgi:hypothetical protein